MEDRIARCEKQLAQNPNNELARFSLGKILFDVGRLDEAREHFALALTKRPDWMAVHLLLGKCQQTLGFLDAAKASFERGLALAVEQHHEGPREEAEHLLAQLALNPALQPAAPSRLPGLPCPACAGRLTEIQIGTLRVDVCEGGCGGVWFDAFELQQVDEGAEEAGEPLLSIARNPDVVVDFQRKRDCPRCPDVKLKRHYSSALRRVEVDHCPNCGGYWLDHGELEKIRAEKAELSSDKPPLSRLSPAMIRYLYRVKIGEVDASMQSPSPSASQT